MPATLPGYNSSCRVKGTVRFPEPFGLETVKLADPIVRLRATGTEEPKVLVAVTVKLAVPVWVGVPPRIPALLSDNPAGSEPEVRDQVTGAVP
jgi:hypothetical protein